MIGDKLIIEEHHTARAQEICAIVSERIAGQPRFALSVAGESGAGKSELAYEIYRLLNEQGIKAAVFQQDDYFVFPPKTNHEMRRRNLDQVGPYEVKIDFLDANLRSFKRGEGSVYKPLVIYDQDRISHHELDIESIAVVIAEGTYTSLLTFVDLRVFIDRDYTQTLEARKKRARDKWEPFIQDVLEREHEIISAHKNRADVVIPSTFDRIDLHEAEL